MRILRSLFIATLIGISLGQTAFAGASDLLHKLSSPDSEIRTQAIQEHRDTREALCRKLIALGTERIKAVEPLQERWAEERNENSPNAPATLEGYRKAARHANDVITTMRLLRDPLFVPFLLDHLLFRNIDANPKFFEWFYPAVAALSAIGLPSIDPMIDSIGKPSTSPSGHRKLAAYTLRMMLGRDTAVSLLEERLKHERDDQRKKSIETLIAYLN